MTTFDDFCLQFNTTEQERSDLKVMLVSLRLRRLILEHEPMAMIYLRTLVAEAERTGSWMVPADLQERISFLVKGTR
jgi:hypothetical protein